MIFARLTLFHSLKCFIRSFVFPFHIFLSSYQCPHFHHPKTTNKRNVLSWMKISRNDFSSFHFGLLFVLTAILGNNNGSCSWLTFFSNSSEMLMLVRSENDFHQRKYNTKNEEKIRTKILYDWATFDHNIERLG